MCFEASVASKTAAVVVTVAVVFVADVVAETSVKIRLVVVTRVDLKTASITLRKILLR